MSYWTMYLITRLDVISKTVEGLVVICGVCFILLTLGFLFTKIAAEVDESDEAKAVHKALFPYMITLGCIFSVGLLLHMTVPTTKEAVAIWAVPTVVNNEQVQQIPENILNLVNEKLKEWAEEVGPEKK